MQTETIKLYVKEKIGYSLGDTASNLFFQTFVMFLLYFYTDVYGLPAAAVGTMFLITRIWDAVNDPLMGMIADRTKSRWGKFRPYLLWLALPFAVIGFLTFTTPDFGDTGKLIYAYITYTLLMMVYTAINVPYSALMGVITPNSFDRTILSSYRFAAAYVGLLIVTSMTTYLVGFFGNGNEQAGWQGAMGCYAVLAFMLFVFTFFATRERVQPPADQKSEFKKDLRDLITNKPWLLIAGATIFQLTYIVIRASSMPYYIKYYITDHQINIFGTVIDLSLAYFLTSGALATLLGAILTKHFTKIFDKKNTYASFMAIGAAACSLFYFLQPQDVIFIYTLNIFISFLLGPVSVLQWAMYTDTADYSEWKNNRRATGLVMSASLFALKLGVAVGGAIVGWVLAYYSFAANQIQTSETLAGILLLMSFLPAIAGVIGGAFMIFYPLNNKMMIEIENDLTARRAGEN